MSGIVMKLGSAATETGIKKVISNFYVVDRIGYVELIPVTKNVWRISLTGKLVPTTRVILSKGRYIFEGVVSPTNSSTETIEANRKEFLGIDTGEKIMGELRKNPVGKLGWNTSGRYEKYKSYSVHLDGAKMILIDPVFSDTGKMRGYHVKAFALPGHPYWVGISPEGKIIAHHVTRYDMLFKRPDTAAKVAEAVLERGENPARSNRYKNPVNPESKENAETILRQLGGVGRLQSMTGAKNFAYSNAGEPNVGFRFSAKAKNKSNYINIELNSHDLYDITFGRFVKYEYSVIERVTDIYADSLRSVIEDKTGLRLSLGNMRGNPVPEGESAKVAKAKRRYAAFRDQPVNAVAKIVSPDFSSNAREAGKCYQIDYTTYRGEGDREERYRHEFKPWAMPGVVISKGGAISSRGGSFRFTSRGFMDSKTHAGKAATPPFKVGMVVGYIDAIWLVTPRGKGKLVPTNKKSLLCVSDCGYNFFIVKEK